MLTTLKPDQSSMPSLKFEKDPDVPNFTTFVRDNPGVQGEFPVTKIWLPGKFNNYQFYTAKFKYSRKATEEMASTIQQCVDMEQDPFPWDALKVHLFLEPTGELTLQWIKSCRTSPGAVYQNLYDRLITFTPVPESHVKEAVKVLKANSPKGKVN